MAVDPAIAGKTPARIRDVEPDGSRGRLELWEYREGSKVQFATLSNDAVLQPLGNTAERNQRGIGWPCQQCMACRIAPIGTAGLGISNHNYAALAWTVCACSAHWDDVMGGCVKP
mgnify:CR=1 FL=1